MACDPSSGVFSFPTRGITHFFMATQNTTERVEEKEQTNKQTQTWVSSKRKKEKIYVTPLCSFSCICRLSRACILRETSTKPRGMLTHLWLCSLTTSFCWPSFPWTAISSRTSSSLSTGSLCLLSDFPSLLHFQSHGRSLCGFRTKTDKEIIWVASTQMETNCYALCHSPN